MIESPAGCDSCEALAYTGRHEPYLVDDLDEQLRLWSCSRCGTLWRETLNSMLQTDPTLADGLIPNWRERARWAVETPVPSLIELGANGEVDPSELVVALLHHEVIVAADAPPGVAYSSTDAAHLACHDDEALHRESVARWAARNRGVALVLDPAGPGRFDVPPGASRDLVADASGTVTEADRRRDEETDA
jgi:hypothetical protein